MVMDSIREGVKKPWAKFLIFAICISFVGAGYFTSALFLGDPYAAAVVNDESVSTQDFERAYSRTKSQYGEAFNQFVKTEEQERNFRENVLQSLISRTIVLQTSRELGLRASNELVRNTIQSMPELQSEGVYSSDLLDRALVSAGMSRAKLKNDTVMNILLNHLSSGVVNTEFVLPSELSNEYRILGQQRSGRALAIKHSLFDAGIEISEEETADFYEETKERFRVEEKIALDYIELSIDSLQKNIQVTDEEILSYYDENIDLFRSDEQRQVSHILIAADDGESDALIRAKSIKSKLDSGEDFIALVKSESSDEFSAESDGDLGVLSAGDMEESFETAMNALEKVGDISEPVKTSFGYHIIKLTGLIEGETQLLDEVKEQIANTLKTQVAEEEFFAKSKILEEKSFEISDSLTEVSKEIGIDVKTSPLFGRNSATGIFTNVELQEEAFGENVLHANINSNLISINENHVVVMRLNSHQQSEIQPIDKVKDQVVATLKSSKAKDLAVDYANSIKEKLQNKEDVTNLLTGKSLLWKDLDKTERTSAALPYRQLQHFFKMNRPMSGESTIDTMQDANELVIFILNDIQDGQLEQAEEAVKTQTGQRVSRFYADADYGSLIENQRNNADVTLNLDNINR